MNGDGMNTKWLIVLTIIGALLVAGAFRMALAEPADVVESVEDAPIDYGTELYDAVKSGDYWYALGIFLIFATIGFRRFIIKWVDWFSTDKGGIAAVGITSLFTLLGTSLMAMEAPSIALFLGVLTGTFTAMGGYVGFKKLVS